MSFVDSYGFVNNRFSYSAGHASKGSAVTVQSVHWAHTVHFLQSKALLMYVTYSFLTKSCHKAQGLSTGLRISYKHFF